MAMPSRQPQDDKMRKLDMIRMLSPIDGSVDLSKPVPYGGYQRRINRYIFAGKFVSNKVILDIGCGAGAGSKYWVAKGAKKVIGVDIIEDVIWDAKSWNREVNGAEFIRADAQALPFRSDTFDVVIALEMIEHLKSPEAFLRECKRVIKEGGTFICSTPNKRVTTPLFKKPRNPHHVKEYYPWEFHEFISNYFTDVVDYGQLIFDLRGRIKSGLIAIMGLVLVRIPGGNNIRELLRRLYKPMLMQPHLPWFREDFDEMADKKYEIISFKESLVKAETLITVAKAGNK